MYFLLDVDLRILNVFNGLNTNLNIAFSNYRFDRSSMFRHKCVVSITLPFLH